MTPTKLTLAVLLALSMPFTFTGAIAAAVAAPTTPAAPSANDDQAAVKAKEIRLVEIHADGASPNEGVFFADSAGATLPSTSAGQSGQRVERVKTIRIPDGADIDEIVSTSIAEAFAGLSSNANSTTRAVKNAPYSADVITERVQILQDGNQIVKRSTQKSFRDSAGRLRSETRNENGEVTRINISDALEGKVYVLSPATKSATSLGLGQNLRKKIAELREKAVVARKDGKATIIEGGSSQEIIINRDDDTSADGKSGRREAITIKVDGSGDHHRVFSASGTDVALGVGTGVGLTSGQNLGELAKLSALGSSFQDATWSAKATTKELGTKEFDGVRAEGKLRSYTIPAGEIGNKNPITVTTETWTSPDLQITVYSKHSDPRVGDKIYRLANLKRSEQPLSLFSLPEGYAVKDASAYSYSFKTK